MITLKKAETVEEVDLILRDPELFARIAEDGVDNYETPFDGHQRYMMIMKGDEPIGVWNLYPLNTAYTATYLKLIESMVK